MKIVHIAPNAPYNDYWGYQDNLLPKYHKKAGHDVTVLITNTMHKNGRVVETECADYTLNDGVRVVRLKKKRYAHRVLTGLCSKLEVSPYLEEIKPDFIFFHGLLSTTIFDAVKYKKRQNPDCIIVQDNHLDYNIGSVCNNLQQKITRSFYRLINKKSIAYVSRVYGVTPWREQYAQDYFKIPKNKTDVLIMGADDEKINFSERDSIREQIRRNYGIKNNDFLVVTGGKIDKKKKIDLLMDACCSIDGAKLLIFGEVSADMKSDFAAMLEKSANIVYIGWIEADAVYDLFFAADLIFFPGQHSVLWEQACATKVPCVFSRWTGMEHVNNGGNSDFLDVVTVDSCREKIQQLMFTEKYYKMKVVAESEKTDIYLYSKIAEKSLETAQ